MYADVMLWLQPILKNRFKKAKVSVHDTSKYVLSKFLLDKGFHTKFPAYQTYEINVDVTGIIEKNDKAADLVFVECKLNKISLIDISQLLGYSKVASPISAVILSPAGLSDSMNLLFNIFRRYDVLNYSEEGFIRVAQWLESRKEINLSTMFPVGFGVI